MLDFGERKQSASVDSAVGEAEVDDFRKGDGLKASPEVYAQKRKCREAWCERRFGQQNAIDLPQYGQRKLTRTSETSQDKGELDNEELPEISRFLSDFGDRDQVHSVVEPTKVDVEFFD